MPIIRVQLTTPTTYNNLGLPSPQPAPGTVDTEGKSVQEYIDYYARAGIQVKVLEVISGTGAIEALQAFGLGAGPAPVGWQAGHEERPLVPQTNLPGSLTPVQNLNDPDWNPFMSPVPGGTGGAGETKPVTQKTAAVRLLAVVAILYFFIWK